MDKSAVDQAKKELELDSLLRNITLANENLIQVIDRLEVLYERLNGPGKSESGQQEIEPDAAGIMQRLHSSIKRTHNHVSNLDSMSRRLSYL
jgi:hypothetical protein